MTGNRSRGALRRSAVAGGGAAAIAVGLLSAQHANAAEHYEFAIVGDFATPLTVGGDGVPLDLTIENPNDAPLRLLGLQVSVRSVDRPGCALSNFVVDQADIDPNDQLTVPSGTDRTLSALGLAPSELPRVRLLLTNDNQDACLGAVVTLQYDATGRISDRDVPGGGDNDHDHDGDGDGHDHDGDGHDHDGDVDHDHDHNGGFLPHTGGWALEGPAAAAGLVLLSTGAAVVVRFRRRQGGER